MQTETAPTSLKIQLLQMVRKESGEFYPVKFGLKGEAKVIKAFSRIAVQALFAGWYTLKFNGRPPDPEAEADSDNGCAIATTDNKAESTCLASINLRLLRQSR